MGFIYAHITLFIFRYCTAIKSVSDVIDAIYERKEVEKILQQLKYTQVLIKTVKNRNDKQMQELQKSRKEAILQIKKFRKVVDQLLDDLEKKSIEKVDNEFDKIITAIKEDVKAKEIEEDVLKKAVIDIENAEGKRAQEFVCSKIFGKKVEVKEEDQSEDAEADSKLSFSVNQDIVSFLKRQKAFGVIRKHMRRPQHNHGKQGKPLYSIKAKKEIDVRTQNDENVDIYGSCLTHDNFPLLSDRANSKIKKVDTTNATVVDQCTLTSRPWSVCCTGINEGAVSLSNNVIEFVSLTFPMKITGQLKMNHTCFGVAFKDGKLYITDLEKALYIYKMSGDLIQKVSTDKLGKYLFNDSRHICFSDNSDRMFVACSENGVVSLSLQGEHIMTYKRTKHSSVYDICSDVGGNLCVCCNRPGSINLVSQKDMSDIDTIISSAGSLCRPSSVCFNHHKCQLIVTELNSYKIKVFDLK